MTSSFEDHKGPAHVLAISFMIQGHITPMLRFTTELARKGITVSFICYDDSLTRLASLGGTDTSLELQSLGFRFVTLQKPRIKGPSPAHTLKDAFEPLMQKLFSDKHEGILGGPTCIISDMFLPWTSDAAAKLQIPRFTLVPSGVIFARFMQGSLDYFERGQFQTSETDGKLVEFDFSVCIPGLPPLQFYEMDAILKRSPPFFRQVAESVMKSAGVLVNSFFELEENVVEVFQTLGQSAGDQLIKVPKIYPVGPLFSTTALSKSSNVYGLEDSTLNCLRWLDSQPSSSVVYIAFGSLVRLSREQIEELACGLEASNQRFLWVCPLMKIHLEEEDLPSSITEVLPAGFEARVGDRGCIVTGWAPQLEILAHSSTGGFFTHCGWNSSVESVIFGVPMVAWPQGAEQHLNCRYLANHLTIAEQLQTGKENIVKRNEVERAVRLVMVSSEGATIRRRAEELKSEAAAAMAEGGSRSRFFSEFLDDIFLTSPNLSKG